MLHLDQSIIIKVISTDMRPRSQLIEVHQIPCQYCRRKIIASNHELHQLRCGTLSTRLRNQVSNQQSQKKQRISQIHRPSQIKYENVIPGKRSEIESRSRQRIFNQPRKQEEVEDERIPCSNCGYMQTFAELDTHPQMCAHQEIQCKYCKCKFPAILIEQHDEQCAARQQEYQVPSHRLPQPRPHIYNLQESDDEQQEVHHPFFRAYYDLPGQNRARIVNRTTTVINGRTIIEQMDQQGNIRRREIDNRNNQNNGIGRFANQPFGIVQRGGLFGHRNHAFSDFFRLLEHLSAQGQQSQGLTKQQIKGLQKLKYKKPPGNVVENEKQLCTICYCEFEQNQNIINLKCKHLYHEECIIKWLQNNAKCPVCKASQTNRPILNEDD